MFHTLRLLCRQVASKLTSSRTPSTFHTTSPGWVASVLPYIYLHLDAIFKQHTSILPGRQFPPVSVDAAKHTRSVLHHQHRSLFTIVTVFTKICTSTATRFFLSIWSCLYVCVWGETTMRCICLGKRSRFLSQLTAQEGKGMYDTERSSLNLQFRARVFNNLFCGIRKGPRTPPFIQVSCGRRPYFKSTPLYGGLVQS